MPQLDTLETGILSFFLAFFIYAFVFWFPEDDADEEDEIEISYLGLRAIQYFEILRACVMFYNLSYYSSSYNLVQSSRANANSVLTLFTIFFAPMLNIFFSSPFEQFMDEDVLFLSFSVLATFFNIMLEEDDYADDDFFTIFDSILEDIVEQASTVILGC